MPPRCDMPIIIKPEWGWRAGVLPPWAKNDDASLAVKMINARSETVHENRLSAIAGKSAAVV